MSNNGKQFTERSCHWLGWVGGITDTTTMMLLGVPAHIAVASSEFAVALTHGAGVIIHGFLQNISIEYAISITIGTIIGASWSFAC